MYEGKKVVGERLRIHAADGVTKGIKITVVSPDHPEPIVIRPEDKIELKVLERNKYKESPSSFGARQRKRILRKSGDAISTAKIQSFVESEQERNYGTFDGDRVRRSSGEITSQ